MQSPRPLRKGVQNWEKDGGSLRDLPEGAHPLRLPSKSHPTGHTLASTHKVLTEQNLSKLEPRNFGFLSSKGGKTIESKGEIDFRISDEGQGSK